MASTATTVVGSQVERQRERRIIQVREIILERDEAKQQGSYVKSDALRDKLKALGVEVIDQKSGMICHYTVTENAVQPLQYQQYCKS